MADSNSFPQLPSRVWWGVRAILNRTPRAVLDERFLSVELGVQETAARQYVAELKRAGILNDEGKATPLAQRWRIDDSYSEAVQEILSRSYPEGLLQVAPPGQADRSKIVAWFTREGLGAGTAANKAATYLLLGAAAPSESTSRSQGGAKPDSNRKIRKGENAKSQPLAASEVRSAAIRPPPLSGTRASEPLPLNVNVQIHIGADASSDQIDNIFSAMRRYLYNDEIN